MSNGSKNNSCRESDRNMLIFTFPMHWKKLVITIWQPISGNIIIMMCSALIDLFMSSGLVVKRRTQWYGTNIASDQPVSIMQVHYSHHSFVLLCSVVVACYRLHSLVKTYYKHYEYHCYAVAYAVCSHRHIASEPH